ncbi:MAG: hypothetical protein M3497_03765 [Gemmatimonadota bacterium]|nr:hypothetical protein [Gemmatimonadota bacterium]
MAEINVERKGGGSILPWIVGLLALLLVGWLLYSMFDRDDNVAVAPVATEPMATMPVIDPAAAPPAPTADVDVGPVIPVAAIVTVPANYVNQTVSGTARVAQVVSDRGFWIDDGNQRVFTIIDEPKPEIKNIRAGQMVRLDGAQVMTAASQVPGQLEAETQQAIQAQPAFLYVRAANIFITQTAS